MNAKDIESLQIIYVPKFYHIDFSLHVTIVQTILRRLILVKWDAHLVVAQLNINWKITPSRNYKNT